MTELDFWSTTLGKMLITAAISMVPVVELRGGIPFGTATLDLRPWQALLASVVGNMLPIPFIITYIRRIFQWMRQHFPRMERIISALERKGHLNGRLVSKYKYLGLYVLVALPLPGTGGWTGGLVAALLDMRLRKALPSIFLGILTAGLIMTLLTHTVTWVLR